MEAVMRIAAAMLLTGLAIAAPPQAAIAAVEVSFVNPKRYSDATLGGGYGDKAREPVLRNIREHLERLGARYLKPDQTLKIDVLDIDLAGRFEWWRPYAYNVRILRGVTWPRIAVRYTLQEDDRTLLSAEESVSDLNYQMRTAASLSSDPLKYEKAMLDDWFRARFVRFKPPSS
jgi:Protein of unknown function (DUF3016)